MASTSIDRVLRGTPSHRNEMAAALRALAMDGVQQANSGHPGAPTGMAEMAVALWAGPLRHNTPNLHWADRDRFVLSNGHASMLLYALLHLSGYALPMDELRRFRQLHSKTPGHPEVHLTPGVETTTGPLGQGLANAVGMALAGKLLADEFNRPGHAVVDHHTYVFLGDGCLMQGLSHEACSLAGVLRLNKLVALYELESLSIMPAHHARRRPLVVANARHSPSYGCALRLDRPPSDALLGHTRNTLKLYDDNGISIDGDVQGWFGDDTAARFRAYGWNVIAAVDGHDVEALRQALAAARAGVGGPKLIMCRTTIGAGSPERVGTAKAHGEPLGADEIARTRAAIGWPHAPFEIPSAIAALWDAREAGARHEADWQRAFAAYRAAHPVLASEFERRMAGDLPAAADQMLDKLVADFSAAAQTLASRKASHKDGPTHQPVEHAASLRLIPNLDVWRPCDGAETAQAWASAVTQRQR